MVEHPPSVADIQRVLYNSKPSDWTYHEADHSLAGPDDGFSNLVWVYNNDVNLRIERGAVAVKDFHEDWVDNFPDPDASSYTFWIYYDQSPVDHEVLVGVDGYRAYLPLPDQKGDSLTISEYDAGIGRIITSSDENFERALSYAEIVVE